MSIYRELTNFWLGNDRYYHQIFLSNLRSASVQLLDALIVIMQLKTIIFATLQVKMAENEDIETGQLLGLLNKYETEILSNDWVQAVIDTDYTESEALPAQFEEQHMQTNWVSLLSETGEFNAASKWRHLLHNLNLCGSCFWMYLTFISLTKQQ